MAAHDTSEQIVCSNCGTDNAVLTTYSGFGPADRERENANCFSCGQCIATARCLAIYAGPSIAEIRAKFGV